MDNTEQDSNLQKDHINFAFSEFTSNKMEHDFRQSTLAENKKLGVILILTSLILIVLICIDYKIFGFSDFFLKITSIRSLGIVVNFSVLFLCLKTKNENHFDYFLLIFSAYICIETIYVGGLRPAGYTPAAIFDIIIIMAIYIIMPTRLIFKLIPCLLISLLTPSLRSAYTTIDFNGLILAHLTSHLVGILFSSILNKNRRIQYILFLNEVSLQKKLKKSEKEIKFISERLAEQNKNLKESANMDQLTGLHNRRSLYEFAEEQWSRAVRKNEECCIIMVDIDHFKEVNDTYGHQAGDIVLKEIAKILNKLNRDYDRLGRWGGEEFILFLPDTNIEQALIVAERLRCNISKPKFRISDELEINITISLGITSKALSDTLELDVLFDHADKALYNAKKEGRNRACIFQNQPE